MIKRLVKLARSNIGYYLNRQSSEFDTPPIIDPTILGHSDNEDVLENVIDPLAKYFSNLELPTNANRKEVKNAWKRLMKKYHPDLYSTDPEKRKVATELSQGLTEAYKVLDKELAKKDNLKY